MRVAIDLVGVEYEAGEIFLATCSLLHGLAQIGHKHEFVVLTVRPDDYQELAQSSNVGIQSVTLRWQRGVLIESPSLLQQIKPDVVHMPLSATLAGWERAQVITIHDLAFTKGPDQSSSHLRFSWNHLQRVGACLAQRIIVTSQQVREEMIASWSIPADRIRLIPHALRPELQKSTISEAAVQAMRSRYG